jgi:hypothetical protein
MIHGALNNNRLSQGVIPARLAQLMIVSIAPSSFLASTKLRILEDALVSVDHLLVLSNLFHPLVLKMILPVLPPSQI